MGARMEERNVTNNFSKLFPDTKGGWKLMDETEDENHLSRLFSVTNSTNTEVHS